MKASRASRSVSRLAPEPINDGSAGVTDISGLISASEAAGGFSPSLPSLHGSSFFSISIFTGSAFTKSAWSATPWWLFSSSSSSSSSHIAWMRLDACTIPELPNIDCMLKPGYKTKQNPTYQTPFHSSFKNTQKHLLDSHKQ